MDEIICSYWMFNSRFIYQVMKKINIQKFHQIKCNPKIGLTVLGISFSNIVYFLGHTTSKTTTYVYNCDKAVCKKIGMRWKNNVWYHFHSSNKKGHKNWGLLLKSMDYIIEWNAPAPVCASQASVWLFPGSIARVLRLHNTTAGRDLLWLCARLAPPFKWISWNAQ